ncbi:DUF1800 domain-containing protein [Rhodobacter maris]|uniref:DUF1800 domain-containing protein n=1 Tax=Rhodobacter maris TaxID=446682 RepID=A0A285RJS2_9RHOB|nr:DUF1800 domain-containing protein [Rhodobacter maris]SOB94114.1 uncharacterized protein SAMN05877831_101330 [Rhodobacter maris]
MQFADLAPVRFGFGPSPDQQGPAKASEILAALRGPDRLAARWPGASTAAALAYAQRFHQLKKAASPRGSAPDRNAAEAAFAAHRRLGDQVLIESLQGALARAVEDQTGFRERLWAFWRDHFTVRSKRRRDQPLACAHAEALRPHLCGNFRTLLRTAVTHPMMLIYLDQVTSFGPNSIRARRHPEQGLGLNENLAREVMELHTLGVRGAYRQEDVRQLAELFTGMQVDGTGLVFAPRLAEPGAETVLGRNFGGDPAKLADIHAALDALALHPDTAQHLARKLAVHFVGPAPDPVLVAALAEAYTQADAELMPVYAVLLTHPSARAPRFEKIRQPFEYIATGLRALGLDGARVMALPPRVMREGAYGPMRAMGQRWFGAPGPNGIPEAAQDWISPQQLSARIGWALAAPQLFGAPVADPIAFAQSALGPRLGADLATAVPRAESRPEAAALVLASAEFMRR